MTLWHSAVSIAYLFVRQNIAAFHIVLSFGREQAQTMEMSSRCRYWILTAVWLMVSAASLGGFEIDNELSLTDNEYVDVEDEFQDIFVERRSLNPMQRNSLEGTNSVVMNYIEQVCPK